MSNGRSSRGPSSTTRGSYVFLAALAVMGLVLLGRNMSQLEANVLSEKAGSQTPDKLAKAHETSLTAGQEFFAGSAGRAQPTSP